jgi:elongation factor P
MISTNDLRSGITIQLDGDIFVVLESQHVKPGKGSAFVKSKLKNLRTGAIFAKTFNAGVKVERAHVDKSTMQYLYSMSDTYYFMNMETYEQIELTKEHFLK